MTPGFAGMVWWTHDATNVQQRLPTGSRRDVIVRLVPYSDSVRPLLHPIYEARLIPALGGWQKATSAVVRLTSPSVPRASSARTSTGTLLTVYSHHRLERSAWREDHLPWHTPPSRRARCCRQRVSLEGGGRPSFWRARWNFPSVSRVSRRCWCHIKGVDVGTAMRSASKASSGGEPYTHTCLNRPHRGHALSQCLPRSPPIEETHLRHRRATQPEMMTFRMFQNRWRIGDTDMGNLLFHLAETSCVHETDVQSI